MSDSQLPGIDDIADLVAILKEGGWRSATVKVGDFELSVSDQANDTAASTAAPTAVAAPEVPSAPPSLAPVTPSVVAQPSATVEGEGIVVVRAETLGAFWRAPQPGSPAFVEVGDDVDVDTPLAIIEVMKLMTRVTAGVVGKVVTIHVENGDLVEAGQPLISIATS